MEPKIRVINSETGKAEYYTHEELMELRGFGKPKKTAIVPVAKPEPVLHGTVIMQQERKPKPQQAVSTTQVTSTHAVLKQAFAQQVIPPVRRSIFPFIKPKPRKQNGGDVPTDPTMFEPG